MLKKYSLLFHSAAALIICLGTLASAATLPADEVVALMQIARTLGKTNWNFSVDPCSGQSGWSDPKPVKGFENAVTCNCSFVNDTVCHVVSIILKSQNLPGTLPKEMINLPYLQEIDLTRNYLNGTIPVEWGSMPLVNISLLANRISGPIPKEFGNISTLVNLTLEYNQLSGTIPPEMGNLLRLEKFFLTSNNLTGELPGTLAGLSSLKDFRIGDNRFLGSIPDYIQNWTNLQKLVIQGSGLNGPIPSGIAMLTNLTDLRISDLNGNQSAFPDLSHMSNLKTLIMRNCNITGVLPNYLGSIRLKMLDLSFNKLSGQIPKDFTGLAVANYFYLTGNSLTGLVPDWLLNGGNFRDFSYNNFTAGSSADSTCQGRNSNLFSSTSRGNTSNLFSSTSRGNTSGIASCLRSFKCPKVYYSFHINCGGEQAEADDKTIYEADIDAGGPSKFFQSKTNWAFSTTGNFLDDNRPRDTFVWTNSSPITGKSSQLYTSARLSPLSLTYYGFCLKNGNYTVNLHFAEIMFTNDTTCNSLGRRMFDICIQGRLVRKDFDIKAEAGGVNKALIAPFLAQVIANTLEIRFYWAGKGTDAVPVKGVYGPLISAISVDPNFYVPPQHQNGLSGGAIAGIVVGVLFSISLLLVVLWWNGCILSKDEIDDDLKGLDLHTGSFKLRQIKAATNNFDIANKIGEGGFGSVYKGNLLDGTVIAVKQLSSKSKQGNREFVNEIGMISALQHPNLVKLYGCCVEGSQLLLIYEYMENNSLARALFGPEEQQLNLDWPTRHKICVGIARGLAYLHEESRLKIVHRDIKATNVLLDVNLDPKISDFGLAKLDDEQNTHISTRIAGTFGYMAPEYAMRGHLTDKADVYSFGIVLLEIVSGKSNTSIKPKKDAFYLLDWANELREEGNLMELVDPKLGSDFNKRQVMATLHLALLCTDVLPTGRPSMSAIVSMLEQGVVDKNLRWNSSVSSSKASPQGNADHKSRERMLSMMSMDLPWTTTTTSSGDLYPSSLDTEI